MRGGLKPPVETRRVVMSVRQRRSGSIAVLSARDLLSELFGPGWVPLIAPVHRAQARVHPGAEVRPDPNPSLPPAFLSPWIPCGAMMAPWSKPMTNGSSWHDLNAEPPASWIYTTLRDVTVSYRRLLTLDACVDGDLE